MDEKRRFFLLIAIMLVCSVIIFVSTFYTLYRVAFQEEKERLRVAARSQARIIEAICHIEQLPVEEGITDLVLDGIKAAHSRYKTFGDTGEFTLAMREGDMIVYLLGHRHDELDEPEPVPFGSKLAEPMHRAISGQSGTMVGLDYRGEKVLAAYEPVNILNCGIVAKIDLSEIRTPFFKAGIAALGIGFVVLVLGSLIFVKVTEPIIQRLRHLNQLILSIRNIDQMITRENDRDKLIQGVCEHLVNTRGFKHAWIILMDEAGKLIRSVECGIGEPFMRLKERLEKGDIPLCAKRALSSPGVIVIEDIATDCSDCPIIPFYQGHINISTRLEYKGKVYGILTSSLLPGYAHEKENQGLFEEVGRDIAFALYNIEQKEKHIEDKRKIFEQEEIYRAIFEGGAEGILITETQTMKIKYTNPAMCRMLGYNEDELIHLTVKDIHPPEIQDRVTSEFKIYERENKPMFRHDIPCMKKDGTITYADVVTTPRIIINGIRHNATFFLDITLRKKAEKDKKEMETQLLQSQKLEAIGQLTSGIAHDFNNILTTIIGNADIILMGIPKDDPTRRGLEEIRAAGDRAASLTSQLLAFSRKQILQPVIINLNETVDGMDKMLRRIIGEDIELMTILSPDLGWVEADAGQIEQVTMNLVVNARDAMLKGGKLTIETANVDLDEKYARNHIAVTPGPYVMLSVSDTGTGMTRDVQEHLFEPFFTTKEKGKGTGLGLSSVYGVVKQSKGNIWVYSEPGKGTTFKVYLPRVEKPIGKKKKDKKPKAVIGSETILIVEDDEMVRNFTVRVLKGLGYRILIAADGQEAIRISEDHEETIHLMLTDMVMPGMSGGELQERLKVPRPDIKALYMSGYTDNSIVHHGVLDKGKAFLQKPFTPDSLGRKVREMLDK